MNPNVRTILQEFSRSGGAVLERPDLEAFLLRSGARSAEDARAVLDSMVRDGLLVEVESPARLRRTEAGRLALARPLDLTLYTRVGCHLCLEMKAEIDSLVREFSACITEVDVDTEASLRSLYGCDVPVLFLADRKVAKHRLDARQLRRQMERARVQQGRER
jgi:hypothetical protein